MDRLFGESQFRNSIVWHYSGWNKRNRFNFNSRHDTILFYGKTDRQVFNSYAIPWTSKEEYVKLRKQKVRVDSDGREYVLSDAGGGKRTERYLEDAMKQGAFVDDVWEIDKLNNSAKEALRYPTQKPEALLDRIISASSNSGDIVLDPFCGCGTAIAVAQKVKPLRRWIGIDVSPTACKLMAQRMRSLGVPIDDKEIIGLPKTLGDVKAMQPFEFQNWVFQKLGGQVGQKKIGDMGIDGWLWDKPVQVKQSDGVGRNVVDNFETALRRVKKKEGIVVAFGFGKGAYEEVARAKLEEGLGITLMTIEDVLNAA